jgi:hypothetical protein
VLSNFFISSFTGRNLNRNEKGNFIALASAITGFILIALCLFAFNYSRALGSFQEHKTAVEAASLAAAQDLSRIVIDDPNYGFIALSDYPPIGKATLAGDGEPLPVLGINTILATARLDTIIANEIGDETLKTLARHDTQNARTAANRLCNVLLQAMQESLSEQSEPKDLDGNPVRVYSHAKEVYLANLAKLSYGKPVIKSFKLSLGWLNNGSNTITNIPEPQSKALLSNDQQIDNKYKAFISIPAGNEEFTFAGLSRQAALVDAGRFMQFDQSKVCSITKLEAEHTFTNDAQIIRSIACAQPGANEDLGPVGQLNISFPGGTVPGIESIRDLFTNDQLSNNKMDIYTPKNGDWPSEVPNSHLVPTVIPSISTSPTVSEAFGAGFYHWLKSNRTKPDIEKINQLIDTRFTALGGPGSDTSVFNFDLLPRAYARYSSASSSESLTYVLAGHSRGAFDHRRDQYLNNTIDAVKAFWRMTELRDIGPDMPSNSLAGVLTRNGFKSVDRSLNLTPDILKRYWKDIAKSSEAAKATKDAAARAMNDVIQPAINNLQSQDFLSFYERNQLNEWNTKLRKAQNAITNANYVLAQSEYIANNQLKLSQRGLSHPDSHNWKLGKVLLRPHTQEAQYNDLINGRPTPSGDRPRETDWTDRPSEFYYYDYNQAMSNAPIDIPAINKQRVNHIAIDLEGNVNIAVTEESPWTKTPVSESQYLGICPKAMITGDDVPITWTATMRDESAHIGKTKGGKHAGQPPAGYPQNYCQKMQYGGDISNNSSLSIILGKIANKGRILARQPRNTLICGGLAFEFQMRAPLIFNCGEISTQEQLGEKVKTDILDKDLAPTPPNDLL